MSKIGTWRALEAEMSYSAMSKSNLKDGPKQPTPFDQRSKRERRGYFLYMRLPRTFTSIRNMEFQSYGALASRIGFPSDAPPMLSG